jgi:hypothetical protein
MDTRLTQEEFLARFKKCSGPLLLALNCDIEQYRMKLNGLIKSQQSEDDHPIDITKGDLEIELVYKALARLISLVYDSESK